MLKVQAQNMYGSKKPPDAIDHIVGLRSVNSRRKCIVNHYPLCDSAGYRYRVGIHTVWVRFLDNGELVRFSGFWFEELP